MPILMTTRHIELCKPAHHSQIHQIFQKQFVQHLISSLARCLYLESAISKKNIWLSTLNSTIQDSLVLPSPSLELSIPSGLFAINPAPIYWCILPVIAIPLLKGVHPPREGGLIGWFFFGVTDSFCALDPSPGTWSTKSERSDWLNLAPPPLGCLALRASQARPLF